VVGKRDQPIPAWSRGRNLNTVLQHPTVDVTAKEPPRIQKHNRHENSDKTVRCTGIETEDRSNGAEA
jgi:hypothetical protein